MQKERKIGFLFDLDGVLIDSETEYSRIWTTINQEFPTGVLDLEKKIKGTTLHNILNTYYPDKLDHDKVTSRLYELENQMVYNYKEGAEELLINLKERDLPVALVTSSNNDKMHHLEEEIPEIFDYFNIIITSEKIKKSKPDPEGYLLAASSLDCEARRCAVFEDSLQGVTAGHRSGAYVVGIEGTLPADTLKPFSHKIVGSLLDFDIDGIIEILSDR